jgi:hypothetical protein
MEAMAKLLQIGGLNFPTKKRATEHFRAILHRHDIGVPIPEPDATQLRWLLDYHPEAKTKIGVGIAHFCARSALYGTRCFEIVRTNGETTDFSFGICIDGKARTPLTEALQAMRAEVTEEIRQKKWEHFRSSPLSSGNAMCAISGREITLEEAYADHASPNTFKSLAERFLADQGIVISRDFVTPPKDNQYRPAMADRELAARWRKFYEKEAVIRIVARNGEPAWE